MAKQGSVETPLTGEALHNAFDKQTEDLLRMGLNTGAKASDLLVVHAIRSAIREGDPHRTAVLREMLDS